MPSVPASRGAHQSRRKPPRPASGLARLMLIINGTSYVLRRIDSDPSAATKAYRLRKANGVCYNVAMTPHGPTCDCPDQTWHREGIDPAGCKHIKAMIAVELLPARKEVAR